MPERPSFFRRALDFLAPAAPAPEAKAADPALEAPIEQKGSGVTLTGFSFVPNGDGTSNIVRLGHEETISLLTAYAVSAYAYVAMRYRAEKLAEPPLMVVQEDQDDGGEEWLPEHPLSVALDEPSLDYDMGELLYRTSLYLDMGGACLWVVDKNRGGLPGRLTPFRQDEFTVEATPERLRGRFIVNTEKGSLTKLPEEVVYFVEPHPHDWTIGMSRLQVALRWLNLSEQTRKTVSDLLRDSVWPSLIVQPDATWNPQPKELEDYRQTLNSYGKTKGKALVLVGGGSAQVVASQITDLLPDNLLNRVESVVASVFGIPAIVLQYQVGMENAPWSQMEEARRMCTEDTLDPRWRFVEKALTRQLLRPMDDDKTLYVRYDRSQIKGLQADRLEQAQLSQLLARDASLNERRMLVGLEPRDEPEADDIPALAPPPVFPGFGPGGTGPGAPARGDEEEDDEATEDDDEALDEAAAEEEELEDGKLRKAAIAKAKRLLRLARKPQTKQRHTANSGDAISQAEQLGFALSYQILAERNLDADRAQIVSLANRILGGTKAAEDQPSDDQGKRFLQAVYTYLGEISEKRWRRSSAPLTVNLASREASGVMATLGIRWDIVQPDVVNYALEETAFLVKSVSDTTRDFVRTAVAQGLEDGWSARKIAQTLAESPEFGRTRARLIARTEMTRAQNGAAETAIKSFSERSGRTYEKVWESAGDSRVRDEHQEIDGEAVPLDGTFSNGLSFPSEPNCRCRVRYREVTVQ